MNQTENRIQDRFQLETALLRLQHQEKERETALRQAKFDLREAKVAEAEYSGSFRAFRDKLTGKREASETALRHAVQKAEASLASAQQEKTASDTQLAELNEQRSALPDWQSLKDGSREWFRLEALLCIEMLQPLLEANGELLVQRRNQFNGAYAGQIKTRQTLAEIYTAPEAAGEACKPLLLRLQTALESLEIPFRIPGYFEGPTAFLSSATKFTRMDRVNEAISQTASVQQMILKLRQQLSE